ncbi:MAG: zf-HC2 domain-containing protein [Candidatus Dormibacteraeota bacterium]|nr:zf-HC2 domain-containing protein [Candidatus Dormibacteraeota bacterium]
MATAQHVEQLFSAAIDDELSPAQEQSFHDHLRQCSDCSTSYDTFTEAIGTVRALPKAAMPLPVHLPTGAPTAERATAADRLRRLISKRLPMGAATGVAALAAVAIVVVGLTRGSAPAQETPATLNHAGKNTNAPAAADNQGHQGASCPGAATAGTVPSFTYRTSAADRSRPGQQLVLSASDATAAAGSQVQIYAVLTIPAQAAGAPGAAASAATTSVTPCLSVTGPSGAAFAAPLPAAGPAMGQNPVSATNTIAGDTFTIPPGTAPGTVIHVVATIPANYPNTSQAPLSATLTITVR